jgi:hypothetical protein
MKCNAQAILTSENVPSHYIWVRPTRSVQESPLDRASQLGIYTLVIQMIQKLSTIISEQPTGKYPRIDIPDYSPRRDRRDLFVTPKDPAGLTGMPIVTDSNNIMAMKQMQD